MNYYNFKHNAPDALIILNRGTNFEQDVTGDLMSFNTQHSIDSITSSFNITLTNVNDKYVNKYGYCSLKKMSIVEIFAKDTEDWSIVQKGDENIDIITIPDSVKSLNDLINLRYGKNIDSNEKDQYKDEIIKLNSNAVIPQDGYSINRSIILQDQNTYKIKSIDSTSDSIIIKTIDDQSYTITATNIIEKQNVVSFIPKDNYNNPITISKFRNIMSSKKISISINNIDKNLFETLKSQHVPFKVPKPKNLYKRIFFGVLLNISQSVSSASPLTVNLTGKSLGYWLESSSVNINPAGTEVVQANVDLTQFANKYADSHALDIFKDLIKFSTDDLLVSTNYSIDTQKTSSDYLLLNAGNEGLQGLSYQDSLNEIDLRQQEIYKGYTPNTKDLSVTGTKVDKTSTWGKLSNEYNNNLSIIETTKKTIIEKQRELNSNAINKKQILNSKSELEKKQNKLESSNSSIKDKIDNLNEVKEIKRTLEQKQTDAEKKLTSLLRKGRENILERYGIIKSWREIFSQIVLEVMGEQFLNLTYPFKWDVREPSFMDGDYQTKASLAQTIASNLNYEFYFDTNGHFVLKPPLYNTQISNDETYILRDIDIINFSLNETVEGMITRIGVAGDYAFAPGLEKAITFNAFQDMNLIRDYGYHYNEISNLLFIHSTSDARSFGISYMAKNNQNLFNASATITGRPNIRLGVSAYLVPRNTVFYIKDISHEFTVGEGFTTTLGLIGGRRIVTGFKAKTNITLINRTAFASDGESVLFANSYNSDKSISNESVQSIEHWVPTNQTNSALLEDSQITQNETTTGTTTFDKILKKDTPSNQKKEIVLKDKYIILNHYNMGYVGLIVDNNSIVISAINEQNYNEIMNLTISNIPDSITDLNVDKSIKEECILEIIDRFKIFTLFEGIYNKPKLFTIELKDKFTKDFTSFIQKATDNKKITSDMPGSVLRDGEMNTVLSTYSLNILSGAIKIYTTINNDLDNNGLYKKFTDADGREMPTYLDFGNSVIFEDANMSVNTSDLIESSLKSQAKRAK
jgi:hypothetical protein